MDRRRSGWGAALVLGLVLGTVGPGYGWVDATTSTALPGGQLVIRGVSGHAIHTHGGAPAQIGHVRFVFENHGKEAQRVTVTAVEFLRGDHDCDHPPQKVVSHPKLGGILLHDGKMTQSAPHAAIAPGATVEATVGFAAVPAYYTYCDRFAFRVFFQVGKTKIGVVSEVNVTREEPLHPRER